MDKCLILFIGSILCLACGAQSDYLKLDSADFLEKNVGQKVELGGRLSANPWQHLVAAPAGYGHSYYFDVKDFQTVVYAKNPIDCPGALVVRGLVIEVRGSSKVPGAKADESYVEYHLTVDGWECQSPGRN